MTRTNRTARGDRRRVIPAVDRLEWRALLSVGPVAGTGSSASDGSSDLVQSDYLNNILSPQVAIGTESATPIGGTYGATQLEVAYGIPALGASNEGQGQTIGIVDVFADSSIIADTNTYSAEYGLPQFNTAGGPTLTISEPLGSPGNSSTSSTSGNDTSSETSIDVEMAHAMAPEANIIMVFVPSGSSTAAEIANLLEGADAAATAGASVVSISYGTSESTVGATNVTNDNTNYLSSTVLPNTVVTVSTGDTSTPSFPATSPNVIAVGGTSLHLNSVKGAYGYESAWGGIAGAGAGGGGASTNFLAPSYQYSNGVSTSTGKRLIPDVSMSADDVFAVAVYDSYDSQDWTAYGGTSVASPLFAGVVALAQQDIEAEGDLALNSVALDTDLYSIYNSSNYATDFHDITLGQNGNISSSGRVTTAGFAATTGYDEATGIGSPKVANLVPMLATPAYAAVPGGGGIGVDGVTGDPADGGPAAVGSGSGDDLIALGPVASSTTTSPDAQADFLIPLVPVASSTTTSPDAPIPLVLVPWSTTTSSDGQDASGTS